MEPPLGCLRRARRAGLIAVAGPLVALAACTAASGPPPVPPETPVASAPAATASTPSATRSVQRVERYRAQLARPLAERVLPADAAVLARAHRTNLDYGQDIRPRPAPPRHPLYGIVRRVLAGLPPPVVRLAERTLTAVFLVEGDWGTATTEAVRDARGRWHYGYIVLNTSALERTANAWASWKERSAFRAAPGYALDMTLEAPQEDDQAGAVRFILLHELGHVVGAAVGAHGAWEDAGAPPLTPFAALSWRKVPDGKRLEPVAPEQRGILAQPAFYAFEDAALALDAAPAVYKALARTNLPSYYGTLNVYDDFAEALAIHVHTALLGKPYRVTVRAPDGTETVYRSCIVTGDCPRKAAWVAAVLR